MLKKSFKKLLFSQVLASSLLVLTVTSCACTDNRKPSAQTDKKDKNNENEIAALGALGSTQNVEEAIVKVKALKENKVSGTVIFTKVPGGIKVVADIDGLTPGKHGFHVHECGDCSGDGKAACEHFNPTKMPHGGPDSPERHVGDLGNLVADGNGHAHYERVDKIISLEGENSILGRSIIIHADPDDYTTQPSGNSGTRIGCGIIEVNLAR